MIYSGYENGHYFVRFTHDVRVIDAVDLLRNGYKIFGNYMLLVKKKYVYRFGEFEQNNLFFSA